MRKTIAILAVLLAIGVFAKYYPFKEKPLISIYELKGRKGRFAKSLKLPADRYPHGFPIEILNYVDQVRQGQRYISGNCRWHP